MGDFKLSDSERYAKSLVRLAIHKTGSLRMASEWTGIQESELSRYGSDDVDRHIPFYRAIELDEAAGDVMLKAWARRRGFDLVSKEQREELDAERQQAGRQARPCRRRSDINRDRCDRGWPGLAQRTEADRDRGGCRGRHCGAGRQRGGATAAPFKFCLCKHHAFQTVTAPQRNFLRQAGNRGKPAPMNTWLCT
jgi:hypothetical protein